MILMLLKLFFLKPGTDNLLIFISFEAMSQREKLTNRQHRQLRAKNYHRLTKQMNIFGKLQDVRVLLEEDFHK